MLEIFSSLIYKSQCPTKFDPPRPQGISYLEREREGIKEREREREREREGRGQQACIFKVRLGLGKIER
jgi:hypothetical protein